VGVVAAHKQYTVEPVAYGMTRWWPWRPRPALAVSPAVAAQRLMALIAPDLARVPALRDGYLVGGAVRDALLGRTPVDLDWLVADPAGCARGVADAPGASLFALDPARGHHRVVWRAGAVSWDFTPPADGGDPRTPGVLEADLRRRDVGFNALALDPASGALHDPCAGIADLRARRVRALARANLEADPLRTLRVVRLAAGLGFAIERETSGWVREVASALRAGRLPLPAPERIGAELDAMLATPAAGRAVAALETLGLIDPFLPELAAGRGVTQGSLHHLDVLAHQLEALQRLVDGFPTADLSLRWATLLHDLGKPATRTPGGVTEEGLRIRERFHGHDQVGATLARELLRRLRRPRERVERVAALVAAHMRPLPEDARAAVRFVHRLRPLLPDLLQLMLADREAARGRAASTQGRRRYRERVGLVLAALATPAPAAPLITGGELMAALALPPGPEVGRLLRAVAEAHALGDVADAAGAMAYARRLRARGR
jgi:poly(A) polymerase